MQSVSSRIWTRVAESISYDDNHYTTLCGIKYSNLIQQIFKQMYLIHKWDPNTPD